MTTISGKVVEVIKVWAGSTLDGDHASGVGVLTVDNASIFDAEGGTLRLDGAADYAYTGIDEDASTIQLAGVLSADVDDGAPVLLAPVAPSKIASVVLDLDGDSVIEGVLVPHFIAPMLPEGPRNSDTAETVILSSLPDAEWEVKDVVGREPEIDPAAIDYPTTTNRCADPAPSDRDNWVGGDVADGGGVWAFGYDVTDSSTYASQGLHLRSFSGSAGHDAVLAPNGDGFTVDLPDPGGFGNSLGTTVATYKLTEDLEFSLNVFGPGQDVTANTTINLYEADGTFIAATDSASYLTNRLETFPNGVISRYRTRVLYGPLLGAYPTMDSVALVVTVGSSDPDKYVYAGSCMAADVSDASEAAVPYSGTSGSVTVYPNPPTAWADVTDKPNLFPPDIPAGSLVPAGGGVDDVLTKVSGTDYDTVWAPAPGAGGGLDDAGVAAVVADDTTPSDTRAALDALPLNTFAPPTSDVSLGSNKLTNVVNPVSAQDAATKDYVDDIISGGPGGATDAATAALVADIASDTRGELDDLYAKTNPGLKSIASITPNNAATTFTLIGIPSIANTGAASGAGAHLGTTIHTTARRVRFVASPASTTNVAGWHLSTAYLWRGNGASLGGFKADFRFAPDIGQTIASRMFTGLTASVAAATDVQPSSLVSCIGVGYDAADTQLYVMHNDASGTCTKVPTGLTRSNVDQSQLYLMTIECDPNASTVDVTVTDVVAGATFTTTISTDLPASNAFLTPRGYCSVGGVSSNVGYALMGFASETNF